MIVWDRGTWVPMGDPESGSATGSLKFRLLGREARRRLDAGAAQAQGGDRGDNWLLIKERDPFARPGSDATILDERPESVLTRPAASRSRRAGARRRRPPRAGAEAVEPALKGAGQAPLPAKFRPQLATHASRVPEGEEWLHEIKFDGYRTLARFDDGEVRLITRTGLDWTDRYGVLAKAFQRPALQAGADRRRDRGSGRAGHRELRRPAGRAGRRGGRSELIFFAFDLLYLDGYDLAAVPLVERKRALEALLEPAITPSSAPADQRARGRQRPRVLRAGLASSGSRA